MDRKTRHTPGPWKYVYLPQHRLRVTAGADVTICDIALWNCDYEEQVANGHLIAAAPDLLEAIGPFAQFAALVRGQRAGRQRAMLELWGTRITFDEFCALHDVVSRLTERQAAGL